MHAFVWATVGICLVLLFIDWGQTKTIARNPTTRREMNPILGPHPSVKKVNIYFAVVAVIVVIGPYLGLLLIPAGRFQQLAALIFAGATAFEGYVVLRNKRRGL
jgi:hypothetical protein